MMHSFTQITHQTHLKVFLQLWLVSTNTKVNHIDSLTQYSKLIYTTYNTSTKNTSHSIKQHNNSTHKLSHDLRKVTTCTTTTHATENSKLSATYSNMFLVKPQPYSLVTFHDMTDLLLELPVLLRGSLELLSQFSHLQAESLHISRLRATGAQVMLQEAATR